MRPTAIATMLLAALFWAIHVPVMAAMDSPPTLISPQEVKSCAIQGINGIKWALSAAFRVALTDAAAAEPLLVFRFDSKSNPYYIVPFQKSKKVSVLVIVDAVTGRYKQASYLKDAVEYPRVSMDMALESLAAYLKIKSPAENVKLLEARLIWKPSEQSQSPFEPLWEISAESSVWYVDQHNKVHDRITEPLLKGGGEPPKKKNK
jgi:hypothetical protein